MDHKIDVYDDFASQYSDMIGGWEEGEVNTNGIMPQFLHVIGDVSGLNVLDAGCGEGYLSRIYGCVPGGGFSVAAPGGSAHT